MTCVGTYRGYGRIIMMMMITSIIIMVRAPVVSLDRDPIYCNRRADVEKKKNKTTE